MSNTLFRKGLVFGTVAALATSALVGTPAFAADEVVFAPTSGTSYNTLADQTFSLSASLAPGQVAGNAVQIKYLIEATSGAVRYIAGTSATAIVVSGSPTGTATASAAQVVASGATSTSVNVLNIALDASSPTTATTSVKVTAFVDSNNDGALTTGEYNTVRTVKFVKYSEVVPTVTLTTPAVGDGTLKAAVSLADINVNQLTAASYKVAFTTTTATAAAVADVQVSATGTATSAQLATSVPANVYLAAGDVVTAQAKYGSTLLGTAVTATVAARTITVPVNADVTVVEGANATGSTARTNSAFAAQLAVKDTASTPAAKAGVSVTAAITVSGSLSTSRTLSVNGTVYNGTTALPTALALTTDASGNAVVNLVTVGFAAAETVTVAYTAQNITVSKQITMADAAFTVVDTKDDTATANRAIAKGGSVTFNLKVADQFGQVISGAVRIKSILTVNGTAKSAVYTAVAAGLATVTVTDDQTAASPGNDSVSFAIETQNASTLNWAVSNYAGFGASSAASQSVAIAVSASAPGFDSVPTPTGSATKFTGTVAPEAYNTSTTALTNGVSILNVAAALSTTVAGQQVTISGTGLLFRVNGKNYADTVTTFSGTNGDFAVTVYGHTSGDQTVTFATGSTTKTAVITFAAGAPALVSLVTPAQAQVGQALDVVINVTDKWSNAVATPTTGSNAGILSVSSTGTGYFASAAPVANAAGKATVKYIVGTADIGTAYLSATLDLATDVTTAKSIEFGLTDADVVAGGHRVFVNSEFAKGRTLTVTIDGVRVYSKVQSTDNAVELAFTQKKKGAHTVTVRISGGLVFTEKVTTN
jgi:hypothetical protein